MNHACQATAAAPAKLKYLELLAALYQAKGSGDVPVLLESVEQRLLELITVHCFVNKPLTMMQILNSQDVLYLGASTISRKIDQLREKGWIRSVTDPTDRRVKFIEPTPKTMAYFEGVNALLPQ